MKKLNPITITLTLALIVSLLLNMNARARLDVIATAGEENRTSYESIINSLTLFRDFEARANGFQISEDILVMDMKGNSFPLKSLLDGTLFCFKFSESNCTSCMKQNFQRVLDILNSESNGNLVFLAEFSSLREVLVFNQMFELKWPVYYLPSSLELPIDVIDEPYFFEVDESFTCSNFQIAASESTELVKSYLRALASKNN